MITRLHGSQYLLIYSCLLVCALGALGCDSRQNDYPHSFFDTSGIPVSAEIQQSLDQAFAELEHPRQQSQDELGLRKYQSLQLQISRPSSRKAASDELYSLWRERPDHFLWAELGVKFNGLLDRTADRDSICNLPILADSSSAVGSFLLGRRFFGYGAKGENYRRAETRLDELDPLQIAWLQRKLAIVEVSEGKGVLAATRLLDWLSHAREIGGKALEYYYWQDIATALKSADRLDDAMHAVTCAGTLALSGGMPYEAIESRLLLAEILLARRESQAAFDFCGECYDLALASDFPWLEVLSSHKMAVICAAMGETRKRLQFDRRCLASARASNDTLNMQVGLMNVSSDLLDLGLIDSSQASLAEARSLFDRRPDSRLSMYLQQVEARFYTQIGDYDKVDSLLLQAKGEMTQLGFASEEARLQIQLIKQGLQTNQPNLAYQAINRLHELEDSITWEMTNYDLLMDIELAKAKFLIRQGDYAMAEAALERIGQRLDEATESSWQHSIYRGDLALRTKDLTSALEAFRMAMKIAQTEQRVDRAASSKFHLGHVLIEQGDFEAARQLFLDEDPDRAFGGSFRSQLAIKIFHGISYAREGRHRKALQVLEEAERLSLPRSPVDLLLRLGIEKGRTSIELDRPQEAETCLLKARDLLLKSDGKRNMGDLREFNVDVARDITEVLLGLYTQYPSLLAGDEPALQTLLLAEEGLGEAIKRADDPGSAANPTATTAVFFVGDDESYLWTLWPEGIDHQLLPGREALLGLIRPVLADLRRANSEIDAVAAQSLADLLLGKVIPHWPQGEGLRILSDDILAGLPWATLPLPQADHRSELIVDWGPITIAQTLGRPLNVEPEFERSAFKGQALIVGVDSPSVVTSNVGSERILMHAEREAASVASYWPADLVELRLGREAEWRSIKELALDRFAVLHIATHTVLSEGLGERATLRFADKQGNTPVTAFEISGLSLDADLVFLSCCETSAEYLDQGYGSLNFARAFRKAGARAVIASSVRVDDEAGSYLSERFYHHWRAGLSKAEALRAAQQDTRSHRPEWRHPFFWAFYQLIGNGDQS